MRCYLQLRTWLGFHAPCMTVAVVAAVVGSAVLFQPARANGQQKPPADYTGSCTTAQCHDGYARKKVVHGPAGMGTCDACHEEADKTDHTFELAAEGAELCLDCHDEEEFEGSVEHQPAAEGDCTTCHDPHASEVEHLLKAPTVGELCAECHDEVTEDLDFLHGPVAAGACTGCHNPHSSNHPSLLLAEGSDLCGKCHAAVITRLEEGAFAHQPAKEDCLNCHAPHGGDNKMNLSSAPPELCFDCHDDLSDAVDDATVGHDPVTTGKACLNCHDPHASKEEHGLLHEPMDLCLSCHDKEVDSDGRKLANIGELLKNSPRHHAPLDQDGCLPCHNPHGGENFRMLTGAFPKNFYAPFDEGVYALCFDCHDSELLEDEETDELTGFRNGERNLHYLHVNREVKGRTCRACHDPHASSKPKQITESVPFGEWSIPINYEPTPTGGSCAPGCHKLYKYDRETPVTNLAPVTSPP